MIRMLLACFLHGIRQECRLCREVVPILLAVGSASSILTARFLAIRPVSRLPLP